jgi:hypothetical protein
MVEEIYIILINHVASSGFVEAVWRLCCLFAAVRGVIAQSVLALAQNPRHVRQDWRNKGVTYHCHFNRKPLLV